MVDRASHPVVAGARIGSVAGERGAGDRHTPHAVVDAPAHAADGAARGGALVSCVASRASRVGAGIGDVVADRAPSQRERAIAVEDASAHRATRSGLRGVGIDVTSAHPHCP